MQKSTNPIHFEGTLKKLLFILFTIATANHAMEESAEIEKKLTDICSQNKKYPPVDSACYHVLKYFHCARVLSDTNRDKDWIGYKKACDHLIPRYPTGRLHWLAMRDIEHKNHWLDTALSNIDVSTVGLPSKRQIFDAIDRIVQSKHSQEE